MSKYTNKTMSKVLDMSEANKDRQKLARYVINFIKSYKKGKLGGFEQIQEKLDKFIEEFIGL